MFKHFSILPYTFNQYGGGGRIGENCVSSFIYSYTISSSSSATVFNAIEMPMHASSFCMTVNAFGTLHVNASGIARPSKRTHWLRAFATWSPGSWRMARLNVR
jgi:hypothetical protein